MFSWLTSISSSILLYIIAGLLTTTLLFGGLCWYLKGVEDQDKAALGVAQEANKTLDKSLLDKAASCDVTDQALAKYQSDTSAIVESKTSTISAINAIPKKPVKATTQQANTNVPDQTDVVDIDQHLPQSLIDLLQQSSSTVQGSVTNNAR